MKNFVQDGSVATVTAPYDVASGGGCLVGSLFGVVHASAANGSPVTLALVGVFDLAKVSAQAWTMGAKVYWDDTAKACTTDSEGNTQVGVALAVAGNPSATGRVRLNGSF